MGGVMMKYVCKDTGEIVHSYEEYLKTRHWALFRRMIADKRGWVCEKCGKKIDNAWDYNIHHKTYKRVGNEKESDVMFLCPDCHKALHKKLDKEKKEKKENKKAKKPQNNTVKHKSVDRRTKREIKIDTIIANIYRLDKNELESVYNLVMKLIGGRGV